MTDHQCNNVGTCLWKTAGDSISPKDIEKSSWLLSFSPLNYHTKFRKWSFIPNSFPAFYEARTLRNLHAGVSHGPDTAGNINTYRISEGCCHARPRGETDLSFLLPKPLQGDDQNTQQKLKHSQPQLREQTAPPCTFRVLIPWVSSLFYGVQDSSTQFR